MQTITEIVAGQPVAIVASETPIMEGVQSALDLIATLGFETGARAIVIDKSAVSEDFFDLSTRIAGEILQKFINYNMKCAIVGDFSGYKSQSLADFIRESNEGKDIFFVSSREEALRNLSRVMG